MGVRELKLAPNAPITALFPSDQLLSTLRTRWPWLYATGVGGFTQTTYLMKPLVCPPTPTWHWMSTDTLPVDHSLLELCLTSKKGLGLFAKQDIKRGTCILSEAPLIVLPSRDGISYHDLLAQLTRLNPDQRDQFHSLHSEPQCLSARAKQAIKYEATVTKRPLRDDNHVKMEERKIITFVTLCHFTYR